MKFNSPVCNVSMSSLMISISPDVRKVQKSCFSANVNIDCKHLKQIKKKVFSSPFRKRVFGMWQMKNGVKMKMAWAVFFIAMIV